MGRARVRLSVALLLPEPTQTELLGVRRAVGCRSLERLAPHVTLVPPVNVREDEVDGAVAVLRRAATGHTPLLLTLGPATTFEPARRVLHLSVTEQRDAGALASLRSDCLGGPLDRPDERPFVPHLTLDEDAPSEVLEAALVALPGARWDVEVDRLVLLRHDDDRRCWIPWHDVVMGSATVRGRGGMELRLRWSALPAPDLLRLLGSAAVAWTAITLPERHWALEARAADDTLLGGVVGRRGDPSATRLVVAPGHRGQGIGTRLRREVVGA